MTRFRDGVTLAAALLALAAAPACSGGGYGGGTAGGGGTGGGGDGGGIDNPYNPNPGGGGQPTTPGANEVFLRAASFDPFTRTVPAGTTVTWRNVSIEEHTITPDGTTEFARQEIRVQGAIFSHRFDTPGTYLYHCEIHGSPGAGMNGRIVVQ